MGRGLLGARSQDILRRLAILVDAHRQRKSLGDEVLCHAVAHQAEADKADARLVIVHVFSGEYSDAAKGFGCTPILSFAVARNG